MAECIRLTIEEEAGGRIDKYLANELKDYTRSFIQKLIEQDGVKVNHKVVNCKYKLKK